MFKVNIKDTETISFAKINTNLFKVIALKTPEQTFFCCFFFVVVTFTHILHLVQLFLFLTLNTGHLQ